MIEDNLKEEWRNYNTSREFSKDIKFNKKWYHLTALFDLSQDDFDFNDDGVNPDNEFDFNTTLDLNYEYNSDIYLGSIDFDFNSVLMEKYKITEIGLIMNKLNEKFSNEYNDKIYNSSNIIENQLFNELCKCINSEKGHAGFYIKTSLNIYVETPTNDSSLLADINEPSKFNNEDIAKDIFKTLLFSAAGYQNEATLQLLGDLKQNNNKPKVFNEQNIIQLISNFKICNNANAHIFPDSIYKINDNNVIPVDLKIANEGNSNVASCNNETYMTAIYKILKLLVEENNITENNNINYKEQNNYTFIKYIKDTNYKLENNKLKQCDNKKIFIPELKGFLLFSSTKFDYNKKQLNFNDLYIRPIIACMGGRKRDSITRKQINDLDDCLFRSKSGGGHGEISYDEGQYYNDNNGIYNENSILYGCPIRFANIVKNFFYKLAETDEANNINANHPRYGVLKLFINDNIDQAIINKIYHAIDPDWKFDFNKNNEENLTEK